MEDKINTAFRNFLIVVSAAMLVILIIRNPEAIGEWEGRRSVAKEQVWIDFYEDCDCGEILE